MLTLTAASFKGVSSNTPLTSHPVLSPHLDYFSVLGVIHTDNVGEIKSLLYQAIASVLPDQDFDQLFNHHYAQHSDSAAACDYATKEMTVLSHIVDSNIQFIDKPYKVNDIQYLKNRLETKLPVQGGYTLCNDGVNISIEYMFRFSGKFFEMLSIPQQRNFLSVWRCTLTNVSRIDTAIDDPTFTIIPFDEMLQACQDKNFSGFRTWHPILDYQFEVDEDKPGRYPAHTLYLGSRKSSEFTRIYNHDNQCLRLETELKKLSGYAAYKLLDNPDLTDSEWQKLVAEIAIGGIQFINRTAPSGIQEKNIDRCELLPFWSDFLSLIGEPLRLPRPNPSVALSSTFNWVTRQVSGFLGAAYTAYGKDKFIKYLESEFERHILKPSRSFLGYISAIQLTDELTAHSYIDKPLNFSPF